MEEKIRIQNEVRRLIELAPKPPEYEDIDIYAINPLTKVKLEIFEKEHGIRIPDELVEWLSLMNGSIIGPGGLYGIGVSNDFIDIGADFKRFPQWKKEGWLSIAGDGCGDYFVLDTRTIIGVTHPVYFIDQIDYDTPAYIVASGVWLFLRFLLGTEQKERFWPFKKPEVLKIDGNLANYKGPVPFPWNMKE